MTNDSDSIIVPAKKVGFWLSVCLPIVLASDLQFIMKESDKGKLGCSGKLSLLIN